MAFYDEKWFVANQKLQNTRWNVTTLSKKEVMIKEFNSFFGPKQGRNG
jgi:hypothetical protein